MSTTPGLPSFDAICSDFSMLDEWEDRYRYLIELGRQMPPLPDGTRTDANKVRGCASQVWLCTSVDRSDAKPRLAVRGDSDAHIVKGLIAVLLTMSDGAPAEAVARLDAARVFADLGLADHLTPQRSNGFAAMVERLRRDAQAALA